MTWPVWVCAVLDLEPLGQAEVGDLGDAVAVEQDVGRLEVAMHDAGLVRRVHGRGERGHQLGRRAARLGRPLEAVGEAPPFEHLERDEGAAVGLADIVDLDDVGMAEPGDGLGLDQEPLAMLGAGRACRRGSSSGDDPVQLAVPGLVDDPHAAAAQLGQELELGEAGHVGSTERRGPGHLDACRRDRIALRVDRSFVSPARVVAGSFGAFQRLLWAVTRGELRRERRRLAGVPQRTAACGPGLAPEASSVAVAGASPGPSASGSVPAGSAPEANSVAIADAESGEAVSLRISLASCRPPARARSAGARLRRRHRPARGRPPARPGRFSGGLR